MKVSITKGELFAIIAAVLWGVNYLLVKKVLQEIPQGQFMLIRFVLTVMLLVVYLAVTKESYRIEKKHYLTIALLGIFGVGLYNIVWTYGIHLTTAANAALLISTSPVFTGIYSVFWKKEKVQFTWWCGTLLAFGGIYLIIACTPGAKFSFSSEAFLGNLLVLTGSILFALYAILAQPLLKHYSSLQLTTFAMGGGIILLIPFSLGSTSFLSLSAISNLTWLYLIYIIVLGTVAAYVFWYKGVEQTGPVKTLVFHYLVPVVSIVMGPFLLGEKISLGQLLGGIIVFCGLLLIKLNIPQKIKDLVPIKQNKVKREKIS